MHKFTLRYSQVVLSIAVWMAFLPLAIGESAPLSERKPTMQDPASIERLVQPLPDDGPRPEGQSSGIDALAWQEGQSAYKKNAWVEAQRFFGKIVNDHPESALLPSAKAFLVELSLRDESSGRNRSEAIQEYKKLLRDHPQSSNARRAEWRIADLYFEQGWYQEAQAFYEQAMAHSLHLLFDGNRALLGLGYTFMATGKWRDAEHAFANVRKRSENEQILQGATLGLAHALFRQKRFSDAQAFYELSYRRWPELLRGDPIALQRYAVTEVELHHDASARELMLLSTICIHAMDMRLGRCFMWPKTCEVAISGLVPSSSMPLFRCFTHKASWTPRSSYDSPHYSPRVAYQAKVRS
ncbi:MAG: tetratricopeptide repeat protein [Nitrospira sp.]|nr:tetratricopeptide repeat protein [Nitrospira sp.]